jgi:hypothetical protein
MKLAMTRSVPGFALNIVSFYANLVVINPLMARNPRTQLPRYSRTPHAGFAAGSGSASQGKHQ